MATIKMVAERAGVSTATVSLALSDPHRVKSATCARVQKAIDALGYAPNFAAKSLPTLRTCKIIVMIPDVSNPFFAEVLRGAEDAAEDAGYRLSMEHIAARSGRAQQSGPSAAPLSDGSRLGWTAAA